MDTRFWGPDGWILLHTITYFLPEKLNIKEQKLVKSFYENMSKILPCKYCRISNQKYMKSLNIDKYNKSRDKMNLWIYLLHNKVNNKLRRQGYCIYENPKFEDIDMKFKNMRLQIVNERSKCIEVLICNKFIGSIIFNFPNYLRNCNENIKYNDLVKLYNDFFNQLIIFSSLLDTQCGRTLKEYLDINPLNDVILLDEFKNSNLDMSLDSKLKLYSWYFNLCSYFNYQHNLGLNKELNNMISKSSKKIKKSKQVSRKKLDSFCSEFKKYIVKSCSDPNIKKTKKSMNTCRKMI